MVALLYATYQGWRNGFVATVYGLVTWIIGLTLAILLDAPLAAALTGVFGLSGAVARPVAFVVVLIVAEAAFGIAAQRALAPLRRAIAARPRLLRLDHAAGVLPSVARMVVVVAVVLAVLPAFPIAPEIRRAIEGSRLGSRLVAEVVALQPTLERLLGGGDEGVLVVTKVSADEQQRLQLPDDLTLSPDPDAEQQLFDLVNRERAGRGLRTLTLDPRLVPIARAHAEEMFRLKYFGHVSPVKGPWLEQIGKAGISYRRAGENLAYAQSVTVAHQGLMESEGHRENILEPEFTHLGIGVVSAGRYGRMFVQLFLTP